ncbi:hypothetical protein PsYK624_127510 [Phanerochaete sordida]|uniref:Uncharacterized protein n=1 Tax=Phanerochaete sordida TaxID=48140 RepID=A0A9P3GLQ7_9APHY|nr:hypothetical protein PsYK624_127510 [Phanerochaete sordida]
MPSQPRRVASFVVYKDDPAPAVPPPKATPFGTRGANARVTASSAHDKENLDPLTGLPPSAVGAHSGKKRKTNALASKLVPVTKPLSESAAPKKRKLAVDPAAKDRKDKKEKEKRVGSVKKASRAARARKATDLPRVEEVEEEEAEEKRPESSGLKSNQLTQVEIDAKCYEFTVLPLADLTCAYDTRPPPQISTKSQSTEATKFDAAVNAKQVETDDKKTDTQASATHTKSGPALFDTPERKRIYASFTFESPSPASRRFASWRESSVPRLPAVNFFLDTFDEL